MTNLEDFDRNPQQPSDEPEPERCVCLPLRRALPRSFEREVVSREGARRLRHGAQALWAPDPLIVALIEQPRQHAAGARDLAHEAESRRVPLAFPHDLGVSSIHDGRARRLEQPGQRQPMRCGEFQVPTPECGRCDCRKAGANLCGCLPIGQRHPRSSLRNGHIALVDNNLHRLQHAALRDARVLPAAGILNSEANAASPARSPPPAPPAAPPAPPAPSPRN